ncbi:MAG: methylated-DNA--[protein]-cysteine S-methyltransferase [Clostridium argentinense]|uniref:Methylated-DNA--protein-cysteine methyltransferase n=1 Tax=Clostridium faecium TaxID=2762223 RepID=A0ABR8YTB4_9CLOT|nr:MULTISPECIES: methylated-DNA--[protein]-cysteine S-methyltransferase [Clostridium]MBD8047228.1 methylated-DNA--[protein]-cysteine S-methyltransferase [Clostridium faecium]MBS5825117.1 methylated-DNA--[protein]-cysteine S-methyltransferase [Clostridium argentinense]MDU1350215.1 methylated-DNA--[protein]-cysteine S-methyltransferase [Clostridium argentinense]
MKNLYTAYYQSPIGVILIQGNEGGISYIKFLEEGKENDEKLPNPMLECLNQLDEYFNGKRKEFKLKLISNGTEFQKKVWNALTSVSYGTTASYKDIAEKINNPKAVRAVGGANNKNPHSIIVPCHRIIGSNGDLVGYGGELWRKQWLLDFEKKNL